MKKLICILMSLVCANGASTWTGHYFSKSKFLMWWDGGASTTAGETTTALDSAYTYNSAGDAFAVVFRAQETGNLTDIYLKVKQFNGTWGSTDQALNIEVREGTVATGRPSATLTGSTTLTLDGVTTGWTNKSGLTIALTAGKIYWIIVSDADGGAVNFATIVSDYDASVTGAPNGTAFALTFYTTSDGFSTGGASISGLPTLILKAGGVTYGGSGFDTIATTANNTVERGIRFKLSEKCTLAGVVATTSVDHAFLRNGSAINLYADGTAPGGTPLLAVTTATTTWSGTSPNAPAYFFPSSSWADLQKDTWYRLTVVPSVNSTTPYKATIGGNPDSTVRTALLPFNGNAHWIEASGGAWDDSQTNSIPFFGPILAPNTDSAGGGSYTFVQ
jgi:hypothetical protein